VDEAKWCEKKRIKLTSMFYRANNEHFNAILADRDAIEQCNAKDFANSFI